MAKKSQQRDGPLQAYTAELRKHVAFCRESLAERRGLLGPESLESRLERTNQIANRALDLVIHCADGFDDLGDPELLLDFLREMTAGLRRIRKRWLVEQSSSGGTKSGERRRAANAKILEDATNAYLKLKGDPGYMKDLVPLADIERMAGLPAGKLRTSNITGKSIQHRAEQLRKNRLPDS